MAGGVARLGQWGGGAPQIQRLIFLGGAPRNFDSCPFPRLWRVPWACALRRRCRPILVRPTPRSCSTSWLAAVLAPSSSLCRIQEAAHDRGWGRWCEKEGKGGKAKREGGLTGAHMARDMLRPRKRRLADRALVVSSHRDLLLLVCYTVLGAIPLPQMRLVDLSAARRNAGIVECRSGRCSECSARCDAR